MAAGLAQAQTHEGFQRRDGSMYIVRNGDARPMTRDVRLPNGRLVTRDGFVVERDGQRVELADGKGCTLLGQSAEVSTQTDGRLTLSTARINRPDAANEAQLTQLQRWFANPGRGKGKGHFKKAGKHKKHGK